MKKEIEQIIESQVRPFIVNRVISAPGGSGLVAASMEIIMGVFETILGTEIAKAYATRIKRHPHPLIQFENGFRLYFKPVGYDGMALRGVHSKTLAIIFLSPGQKKILSEFYLVADPGCETKIFEI